MLTKNMAEFSATIKAHAAADLIERGTYYDEESGRGCFIGCLTRGDDIALIAEKYGLPMPLTRLLEHVFENLDIEDGRAFFTAIPDAIGRDGRDLSRVHWAFLREALRTMPAPPPHIQPVTNSVIAGMDILARGGKWEDAHLWAEVAAVSHGAVSAVAWAAEAALTAGEADEAYTEYWDEVAAEAAARAAEAVADIAANMARGTARSVTAARASEIIRQRDALLRMIREA